MMSKFGIKDMRQFCIECPVSMYSEIDYLGQPTGIHYDNARYDPRSQRPGATKRKPLRSCGLSHDIRTGALVPYDNATLYDLDFLLQTCSFIKDIRCYYPLFSRENRDYEEKPVIVLDRVLSLELKEAPGEYHLHAVITRPTSYRLFDVVREMGLTIEIIHRNEFPLIERENARTLYTTLKKFRIDDLYDGAFLLANLLKKDRRRDAPLIHRLDEVSMQMFRMHGGSILVGGRAYEEVRVKRIGAAFRLLCAAVVLGLVRLNSDYPLRIDRKLHLM